MNELLVFFSDASTEFQHNKPKKFRWTHDRSKDSVVLYTDKMMMMPNKIGKIKIGVTFEPREINGELYGWLIHHYNELDYIFTWDKQLAAMSPKFIYVAYGTSWLNESLYSVYPKTKMTSAIVSEKKVLKGHQLRHSVVNNYKDHFDLYGRGYNKIETLLPALQDYRFNIVIENTNEDCNLSEKLITPLLCGTVPIYWGCPSISDYFNMDGILTFNTIGELGDILSTLTEEKYQTMFPAVQDNFERAKEFELVENRIYDKLIEMGIVND